MAFFWDFSETTSSRNIDTIASNIAMHSSILKVPTLEYLEFHRKNGSIAVITNAQITNSKPLVALCFSGQWRGGETHEKDLKGLRDQAQTLGSVSIFASIHLDLRNQQDTQVGPSRMVGNTVTSVIDILNPAAWDIYDVGEFTCPSRVSEQCHEFGPIKPSTAVCTFLAQFSGVRHSFVLMKVLSIDTMMHASKREGSCLFYC
jgi:hypothetical protein